MNSTPKFLQYNKLYVPKLASIRSQVDGKSGGGLCQRQMARNLDMEQWQLRGLWLCVKVTVGPT